MQKPLPLIPYFSIFFVQAVTVFWIILKQSPAGYLHRTSQSRLYEKALG